MLLIPTLCEKGLFLPHMDVVEPLAWMIACVFDNRAVRSLHVGKPGPKFRLHSGPFCFRNLAPCAPESSTRSRPRVTADENEIVALAGVERQQCEVLTSAVCLERAADVRNMPAEVPDCRVWLDRRF